MADREIHCSNRNGHGMLDLRHALMESCNAALMDIGLGLGRNKFSKYNKLYGFGQRTGVDLPGETSGLIHTKEELNPVELATSSFGQTQTVTMVQMLSGFSSLINGGNYYQPHLVKEIKKLLKINGRRRNCGTGTGKRIFHWRKDRYGGKTTGIGKEVLSFLYWL